MSRQLLNEHLPLSYTIVERQGPDQRMSFSGKVQHANIENLNKRKYPYSILEREVSRLQPLLKERAVVGELDHPEDGKTKLYRASHIWTSMDMDKDGIVTGTAEALNTPRGLILQELFRANAKVGASSRGQGSVNSKTGEVQEDYQMETIDMVYRPSTPGAYPQLIREEQNVLESFSREPEKGLRKLQDLRRLVAESRTEISGMTKQSRIEVGAQLMHGEFLCGRLMEDPNLKALATESYWLAHELRKKVEESLGFLCDDNNVCRLAETTTSSPSVSIVVPTAMSTAFSRDAQTKDENELEGDTNMSDTVLSELKAMREAIEKSNVEIERLRVFEKKFEVASKIIEGLKNKVEEAHGNISETNDRADAAEALLREATGRLERLETTQSAGLRRRLEKSEELIAELANRVQESQNNEVLAAAEELGEELLQRLAEAHQRAEAAEKLLDATLECVQEDAISSELDHLLESDPKADQIRPILEGMDVSSIEELRAQYARIRALRKERHDSTLPLSKNLTESASTSKAPTKVRPVTDRVAAGVTMALALDAKMRNGR